MSTTTALSRLITAYRQQELAERRPPEEAQRPGAARGRIAVDDDGDVEYLAYGVTDERPEGLCELVATLGSVESEYAALRRGAGILDCPHRGTVRVSGDEARQFLNRMLTADLRQLQPWLARPSFWLNRKGRIDADLLVVDAEAHVLLDVDATQAGSTASSLGAFVVLEEVEILDVTDAWHRLAVHGPLAIAAVAAAAGEDGAVIATGQARSLTIGGVPVVAGRRDQVGAAGLELFVPADSAPAVWQALVQADRPVGAGRRRVRPIGWHAYNIARIEAGTPLFNVDFGINSLPHETGVLADRVSFEKGCFLGQEVVTRMERLGKPRRQLVGLRVEGEFLPVAGGQVFRGDEAGPGTPIGTVTSSTISPMLGSAPIALAMLETEHAEPGHRVLVNAEGRQVPAVIGPLRSWTDQVAGEPS